MSPFVAQSRTKSPFLRCPKSPKIPRFWCTAITAKIPFLTVRENRENPTPPGGISPPPLAAFPPPVCRGRVLSYPAALSVGKTRHEGAANSPTRARWIFCIFARFPGGVVIQPTGRRDCGPLPPGRVCRFRRGCCPEEQAGFPLAPATSTPGGGNKYPNISRSGNTGTEKKNIKCCGRWREPTNARNIIL